MFKGTVIVVDDDGFFRAVCSDILKSGDYYVLTASSGQEALGIMEQTGSIDLVVTDLVMPGMDGLELIEKTKHHNALIDAIVITGQGTIETAVAALKAGAFDYINKPINGDELLLSVDRCMEKRRLLQENAEMRRSLQLFEVTKAVTAVLDINRLYGISLDALQQIIHADAGMAAFYENNMKALDIKALRHIPINEGAAIIEAFRQDLEKGLLAAKGISLLPVSEGMSEAFKDYGSIAVSPVLKAGAVAGFLILLGRKGVDALGAGEMKNAEFVAGHISQAFENALKYVEAKEMAFVDSLTNLYNGKYLDSTLEKELKRADRMMRPVTVLFMDLDNFKRINDTNDHLVGSKVLIEVARVLMQNVRDVDTVVRYGGDEYVAILIDADYSNAMMVAERIRRSVEETAFLKDEGRDIRVTISIGVASYPVHGQDKKELLKTADKAMYSAKEQSRNRVVLAPLPEK